MPTVDKAQVGIEVTEKAAALELVLQSGTFARAGRSRDLLRFLCEATFAGRESELNEYTIGTGALGRPQSFSPLEDSSVRRQAFELRNKLEKFYEQEHPAPKIRIELRKGSYVPRFIESQPSSPAPVLPPAEVAPVPIQRENVTSRPAIWFAILAFVTGAAVAVILTLWLVHPSVSPGWTHDLESIWRPFIDTETPTIIAVESRFFVNIGPLVVRDAKVDSIAGIAASEPLIKVKKLFAVEQLQSSFNYADAGCPQAIFYLTRLLTSRLPNLSVKSFQDLSADEFNQNNIILIGKPWMDPRLEKWLAKGELIDKNGRILNRHPLPGELPEYTDQKDPNDQRRWSAKYSVISFLPGKDPHRRLLALTGSGSEHAAALAWYFTDPRSIHQLLATLKTVGTSPTFFQVLVRFEFQNGSLARVEYVTSRTVATDYNP